LAAICFFVILSVVSKGRTLRAKDFDLFISYFAVACRRCHRGCRLSWGECVSTAALGRTKFGFAMQPQRKRHRKIKAGRVSGDLSKIEFITAWPP
jgi:hypothetical protein